MEGGFLDEEWESLSKMFCGGDTPHDDGSLFPATGEIPFVTFSENSYNLLSHDHTFDTNFCSNSQESSNTMEYHHEFVHDNASFESMAFYNNGGNLMMPIFSDDAMEEILNSKDQHQDHAVDTDSCKQIKRKKCHEPENSSPETISPNKIPRVSRKNAGKNGKKKKIQEKSYINEEESKSSCSSEDDSQEVINGDSTNSKSKGKSKATDPQSLYARRRRERINERLKILQNLVPNGTKVDISTMLEEAVQYVKFLQLQIKLLSSDDMWMFAPLAYNGMDIGMYQKISPNLRLQIN